VINLVTVKYFAGLGVYHQNLPRTHPALGNNIFIFITVRADLGRDSDEPIFGLHPPRRSKPVAIQYANRIAAIGEHDACGAVPGLHVHGVIFIKRFQVRIHGFDILPGGRDQHAQGTRHIHSPGQEHFEHIIETGRIGATAIHQGCDIRDVR